MPQKEIIKMKKRRGKIAKTIHNKRERTQKMDFKMMTKKT